MVFTVASYKGGVGKTTTAVHLAAYLNTLAPTLLLDGDPTRNATAWSQRGAGFPFKTAFTDQAAMLAGKYVKGHIVIDTGQRPSKDDLEALVSGCNLLVVPAVPSALDTDGLGQTIRALQALPGRVNYKILLTRVPADAAPAAAELRAHLAAMDVPMFSAEIPRLKAFEKAADKGGIVSSVDDPRAGRAWAAYEAAGKELGL